MNGSRHFLRVRQTRAISGIGHEGNESKSCSAIRRYLGLVLMGRCRAAWQHQETEEATTATIPGAISA